MCSTRIATMIKRLKKLREKEMVDEAKRREQRLELFTRQYKAMLAARRGHNYSYMTPALEKHLERLGYRIAVLGSNGVTSYHETRSDAEAKEVVERLRREGNYARIICHATRLRIREYSVYYRKK